MQSMKLFLVLALWLGVAQAVLRQNVALRNGTHFAQSAKKGQTFVDWYNAYSSGRGVWKWHQALEAYQIHMGRFAGQKVSVLEIGVQSGGSIDMYKTVLGGQCHYYGMDINPKCTQFADQMSTISILDQGNAAHWSHFFTNIVKEVDIIVDDGGHQAFQMLTTLQQGFPHLRPGGVHLIEDIHGQNENYIPGLFNPAADFLAAQGGQVASVHIYPFVMVAQKTGGSYVAPALSPAIATVDTFEKLFAALPYHRGKILQLQTSVWPSLLSADSLKGFFSNFYQLHTGSVTSLPVGCFSDGDKFPECTMHVTNTQLQSLVTRVDIYASVAQIHVAAAAPSIYAKRRGNVWIPYKG